VDFLTLQEVMNEQQHTKDKLSRRSFFKRSWGWLGILAGVEFGIMTFSFFRPVRKKSKNYANSYVKTVGEFQKIPPGSVIPFKDGKFYLVRLEDGGMMALSLNCTHLGCSVTYSNDENQFVCPCHASVFDIRGNVLNPPAPRALDMYRVFVDQGMVKVDTGKVVRRRNFSPEDLYYG
jgi:cytochrome b6-f complex iron-sulfur subunit